MTTYKRNSWLVRYLQLECSSSVPLPPSIQSWLTPHIPVPPCSFIRIKSRRSSSHGKTILFPFSARVGWGIRHKVSAGLSCLARKKSREFDKFSSFLHLLFFSFWFILIFFVGSSSVFQTLLSKTFNFSPA